VAGKDSETRKPVAKQSEVDLLALRTNVKGRRLAVIQGGIEGLLEVPWKDGRSVLSRIGRDIDLFFNFENFDDLKQRSTGRDRWEELIYRLPMWISSDSWSFDPKNGEFKYGGFDLGCSITEILCRLAGVGLTDDEIKQLEAAKEKDNATGADERFVAAHEAVDHLFDQDFKRVAKEIWDCWQGAKETALQSLDDSDNEGPGIPGSSEPAPLEASEAESETADTEDPDPGSGQEPDSEVKGLDELLDDPTPEDTPAEDSE